MSKCRMVKLPSTLSQAKGKGGETIKELINAGANPNVPDNDGMTPIDLARKAPQSSAWQILLNLGFTEN